MAELAKEGLQLGAGAGDAAHLKTLQAIKKEMETPEGRKRIMAQYAEHKGEKDPIANINAEQKKKEEEEKKEKRAEAEFRKSEEAHIVTKFVVSMIEKASVAVANSTLPLYVQISVLLKNEKKYLAKSQSNLTTLQEGKRQADSGIKTLRAQQNDVKKELEKLDKERRQLLKDQTSVSKNNSRQGYQSKQSIEKELAENNKKREALLKEMAEIEKLLKSLEKQAVVTQKQIDAVKQRISALQESIEALKVQEKNPASSQSLSQEQQTVNLDGANNKNDRAARLAKARTSAKELADAKDATEIDLQTETKTSMKPDLIKSAPANNFTVAKPVNKVASRLAVRSPFVMPSPTASFMVGDTEQG